MQWWFCFDLSMGRFWQFLLKSQKDISKPCMLLKRHISLIKVSHMDSLGCQHWQLEVVCCVVFLNVLVTWLPVPFSTNCLNWKIYCDDLSLSSTTTVQIWTISCILHISINVTSLFCWLSRFWWVFRAMLALFPVMKYIKFDSLSLASSHYAGELYFYG